MKIFISRDNQKYGPYTIDQINSYLATKQLFINDFAWYAGAKNWIPLSAVPGVADATDKAELTGIKVTTKHCPLQFLAIGGKPRMVIDGIVYRKKFGTHFFELSPGKHTITFLWNDTVSINLNRGSIAHIQYKIPLIAFTKGSIKVEMTQTP